MLRERGHESVSPGEVADVVIVNTCAVTAESGRKSRQVIRRLRDENPGAVVAVSGCWSQISPDDAAALGAGIIFGTGDRRGFIDAIEKAGQGGSPVRGLDDPFRRREFEQLPAGAVSGRTRAMLKVQDGCVNFCSYCIIPYTRGRLRSLPVRDAAAETARIASEGYMELVITGIEVASYGFDLPDRPNLADLICACAENSGEMRIRLGSLEPTVVTEEFCRRLADTNKLCRHFHLSLQSGCDRTLKAMNRKYNTEEFFTAVSLLRKYFPGCGLTCDLITGFPGETDEDFRDTLAFIRRCGFSAMHIFPYSRRPGTPADSMPEQCTQTLKARRASAAQQVCEQMHREYLESSIGQIVAVLFETEDEASGTCTGHSDTYVLVTAAGHSLRGKILDVRITGTAGEGLVGELTGTGAKNERN